MYDTVDKSWKPVLGEAICEEMLLESNDTIVNCDLYI